MRARLPTRPWTCCVRCGFPWSARAGKASSCPSRASLIVYSSALYQSVLYALVVSRSQTPRRHAVTQPESFPGRPRGRRARHDGDVPERQGYDATPQDQREFPDLAPIRPREARERNGRGQAPPPARQACQPAAGGPAATRRRSRDRGRRPGDPGPGGSGRRAVRRRLPGGGYGAPAGQAPWAEQPVGAGPVHRPQPDPAPSRQPAAGARPRRRARRAGPEAGRRGAVLGGACLRRAFSRALAPPGPAGGTAARGAASDSLTARRARPCGRAGDRGDVYLLSGGPGAANLGFGSFVTTFLPGELQQVPDPCTTVPAATLQQYLPGNAKEAPRRR